MRIHEDAGLSPGVGGNKALLRQGIDHLHRAMGHKDYTVDAQRSRIGAIAQLRTRNVGLGFQRNLLVLLGHAIRAIVKLEILSYQQIIDVIGGGDKVLMLALIVVMSKVPKRFMTSSKEDMTSSLLM